RTWTFVDACGNSSSASQTINVIDNVAPTAPEAPEDVTVSCEAEIPAMTSLTATDNCGEMITVEGQDQIAQGACAGTYTVTRTWTFVDSCGNTSSATQTINVIDNVAPTAPQAPEDVTVACESEIPAMTSLTASDNCGETITVEGLDEIAPGACAGTYTVTRTWTFVDACGNSSSATQTINVIDNVAPVFDQLPATSTIFCPAVPEFAQA